KVKNITANAVAARRYTRVRMACPRILAGIHNEALRAIRRRMCGQRAAPPEMAAIKAAQHDTVVRERHFHRDAGLHRPKINPKPIHGAAPSFSGDIGKTCIWTNAGVCNWRGVGPAGVGMSASWLSNFSRAATPS